MPRDRLPARRACQTFEVECQDARYTASVGFFPDGRVAEIFLNNGKAGSQADVNARDAAIVASLALQSGADLETIRQSLSRDPRGLASGPLGAALDIIALEFQYGPNGPNQAG